MKYYGDSISDWHVRGLVIVFKYNQDELIVGEFQTQIIFLWIYSHKFFLLNSLSLPSSQHLGVRDTRI